MSRHASREEALAVIREEQLTPIGSNTNVDAVSKTSAASKLDAGSKGRPNRPSDTTGACPASCCCQEKGGVKFAAAEVEEMLKEKEAKLRAEFAKQLEQEEKSLRERFDFILENEQVRTCHMLREAHRERQEKVQALQTQLECKNMAGLMYVMCSERRKSKLEKLRVIEEYTNYIRALQDILSDGQRLILYLSRGYKTAAKVDQEWRDKMKLVIKEFINGTRNEWYMKHDVTEPSLHGKQFQEYVYHFAGGSPDTNQYIFDVPALLKTKTPIVDNPEEDPCDCEEEHETTTEPEPENTWWERLEGADRPFVMFGDMAEFRPPQRREVLRTVKAAKTAPPRWKDYVFNEMFLKDTCPNTDSIKDEYPKRLPVDKWECQGQKTPDDRSPPEMKDVQDSQESSFRRYTTTSMEMRAAMGSILRMITASNYACGGQQTSNRANLLAARDSMEIASTTKLREKHRESINPSHKCMSISFGGMQTLHVTGRDDDEEPTGGEGNESLISPKDVASKSENMEAGESTPNALGSLHRDSLGVITNHVPDMDHKINYEKVCPMDKCQRLQVDSFMRSLPAYMRASPFTHFQNTFEDYETCSPDQLEILKQRLEDKKKKGLPATEPELDVLDEWTPAVDGVGVQTSDMSVSDPPCTCNAPSPTPATSVGNMFNVEDMIPVKEAMDEIHRECFYDNRIEFDRFKVIGQETSASICNANKDGQNFKQVRVAEIQKILKKHPSMLDLFQGNTRC